MLKGYQKFKIVLREYFSDFNWSSMKKGNCIIIIDFQSWFKVDSLMVGNAEEVPVLFKQVNAFTFG